MRRRFEVAARIARQLATPDMAEVIHAFVMGK